MFRQVVIALTAVSLLAVPAIAQETGSGIEVTQAAVGTGVKDRALEGANFSFKSDVGKVFFHTTLEGDFPETELSHVWKREGAEVSKVNLKAKGPTWRTWSSKTIPAWATGNWTVSVVDASGKSLKDVAFTVEGDGDGSSAAKTMNTKAVAAAADKKMVTKPAKTMDAKPPAGDGATKAGISVDVAKVGTAVENRELTGAGSSFPAGVGKVFFHTTLSGDFGETELEHVWTWNGKEVSRVTLKAKGPRWRTWSFKTIPADGSGDWSAQVVAGGKVLESVDFKVGG